MKDSINTLYRYLYRNIYSVYDVFINFFGEDYVDLHYQLSEELFKKDMKACISRNENINLKSDDENFEVSNNILDKLEEQFQNTKCCIYVWWPSVKVTNEYGKYINIQDLYAKIYVSMEGTIPYEYLGFQLNRATYTEEQFYSNYLHSHVRNIPKSNFTLFETPCLGTGPIKNTIYSLKSDYSEIMWMLFCQELNNYVSVESIAGGPWRRLENVGNYIVHPFLTGYKLSMQSSSKFVALFSIDILSDFIKYYLKNGHLAISYRNSNFMCGLPYYKYIIDLSNCFIEYFNKNLLRFDKQKCFNYGVLQSVLLSNGKFYSTNQEIRNTNLSAYQNQFVLNFKGTDIKTKIIDNNSNTEVTPITVFSQEIAMYILHTILTLINFNYNNGKYPNNTEDSSTSSSTDKGYCYI